MSDDLILESREAEIVTLSFNDPVHLNAMTEAMGKAFRAKIEVLAEDSSLRALIITGRGRAFSAGGDFDMIEDRIREAEARSDESRSSVAGFMRDFYELFLCLRDVPCPTIAAINGHAIGAGFCVALACDMRFIAREARVGLNFSKLGLHPGMGASWTLPRLVGPAVAAELLATSRIISGDEAERLGLANRAFPQAETLSGALAVASEIAECGPFAVRQLIAGLSDSENRDLAGQLDYEAASQARCFERPDVAEGFAAARERRAPRFE